MPAREENVDTEWFLERMRERGMSMRALARQLGYDIAVLSRLINGHRRVRLSEVEPIARALGASLQETSAHFGLGAGREGVPVTMTLRGDGTVVDEDWGEQMMGLALPEGSEGIRAMTTDSAHQLFDGWTFIAAKEEQKTGPLGRLALLSLEDGPKVLGTLQRVFPGGRWTYLVPGAGGTEQRSGVLRSARQIVSILP